MPSKVGPVSAGARTKSRAESHLDSQETAAIGEALWSEMKRGEEPSLALMAKCCPATMRRQLRETDPTRLLADVVAVHLARLNRETALDLMEQWLDAARLRVRPGLSDARQISLFGRLAR
jgi:hypothetical protein